MDEIHVKALERRNAYLEREIMLLREDWHNKRFAKFPLDGEAPKVYPSPAPYARRYSEMATARWMLPEKFGMAHHLVLGGHLSDGNQIAVEYRVDEHVFATDRHVFGVVENLMGVVADLLVKHYEDRLSGKETA